MTRSPLVRESARCSACPRHTFTLKNEVSPSRQLPLSWMRWVTATRRLVTGVPVLVNRSSGVSTRLPAMVVWLSVAISCTPYWMRYGTGLAFRTNPLGAVALADDSEAGGAGGISNSVVLAGQPHDGVGVVLAGCGDGDPGAERKGGLPFLHGLSPVGVVGVGGDAVGGIEPVKGLLRVGPLVVVDAQLFQDLLAAALIVVGVGLAAGLEPGLGL